MVKAKLKLVTKRQRAALWIRALIIYRKKNITAKKQRAYSSVEKAILGATSWIMRDGEVGTKIMIYDPVKGQEIAVIKMSSLGNIRTTYPWSKK